MKESFNTFFFDVVKNHYADFTGRASRKQFWMYVLWNIILSIVVSIVGSLLFRSGVSHQNPLSILLSALLLIPSLAIGTRRLHDIGKSGWWQLVALIPLIGWIVPIYFFVQETVPGSNAYGASSPGTVETPTTPTSTI